MEISTEEEREREKERGGEREREFYFMQIVFTTLVLATIWYKEDEEEILFINS